MTRSWMRKTLVAAAAGAVLVLGLAGTFALATQDDTTLLVGVTADRGPQYAHKLVIRNVNVPYVGPPGQLPPDEDSKPKPITTMAISPLKSSVQGTAIGGMNLGGGVGLIASATPQMRLEKSLKDLARELR